MKKYSFLLKDGFRVDVKAATPKSAYNKLKAISFLLFNGAWQQTLV